MIAAELIAAADLTDRTDRLMLADEMQAIPGRDDEADLLRGDRPLMLAAGEEGVRIVADREAERAEGDRAMVDALLDSEWDGLIELPTGREVRQTATGWEAQPPRDSCWLEFADPREAIRFALGMSSDE